MKPDRRGGPDFFSPLLLLLLNRSCRKILRRRCNDDLRRASIFATSARFAQNTVGGKSGGRRGGGVRQRSSGGQLSRIRRRCEKLQFLFPPLPNQGGSLGAKCKGGVALLHVGGPSSDSFPLPLPFKIWSLSPASLWHPRMRCIAKIRLFANFQLPRPAFFAKKQFVVGDGGEDSSPDSRNSSPCFSSTAPGAESQRSRTMLQRLRRVDDLLKCLCVSVGCSPTALLVQAFEMTLDRSSDNTWSSTRASPETPPPLSSLILLSHSGGPLSRAREGPRRRHRHRQCRR